MSGTTSDYQFVIEEDGVHLKMDNEREWIFKTTDFDDKELEQIISGNLNKCGGCHTMPNNGFRSNKFNWCMFSRKIASLQEEQLQGHELEPEESEYDDEYQHEQS